MRCISDLSLQGLTKLVFEAQFVLHLRDVLLMALFGLSQFVLQTFYLFVSFLGLVTHSLL